MLQNIFKKGTIQKIFRLLYYVVISFVCSIGAILVFYIISSQLHASDPTYRPAVSVYTIVSPSMTPVIKVYDVVVNVKIPSADKVQVGDIITYISASPNAEGMTITHRVIEVNQLNDGSYEYLTQGDNNSLPDSLYVTFDQIIGKEVAIIPYLGKIQFLIANKKGWLFLLLIPIAFFLLRDVYKVIHLFGLRKKVDKVSGIIIPSSVEEKKILEAERKEQIKENLIQNRLNKDAYIRSSKEPEGFLEKYSETIVEVTENRYKTTGKKKEKTIKPTIAIEEKIEILETDELTTKIKEYDTKLAELNKMLSTMRDIKSGNPEKNKQTEIEELLNEPFLQEEKIKVLSIEDIKTIKKETIKKEVSPKATKKLNLNPKEIKQVNRKPVPKKEAVKERNPNKNSKTTKEKKIPKKKSNLIRIEKVKK